MQTQRATSSKIPTNKQKNEVKSHICNMKTIFFFSFLWSCSCFFMCIKRSLHLYGPLMGFMRNEKGEIDLGPIGDEGPYTMAELFYIAGD